MQGAVVLRWPIRAGIFVAIVIVSIVNVGDAEDLVRKLVNCDAANAASDPIDDCLSRCTLGRIANRIQGDEIEADRTGPTQDAERH